MVIDFLGKDLLKDPSNRHQEKNVMNQYNRPKKTAHDFYKMISHWKVNWGSTHDNSLLAKPASDEIDLVAKYYRKWFPLSKRLEQRN